MYYAYYIRGISSSDLPTNQLLITPDFHLWSIQVPNFPKMLLIIRDSNF